ncbi:MAG: FtsQ-type POTRA domain-containing protein [Myxococcota bacterium]
MSLLRLFQRIRTGRSGERRGTPPAVEAALRAKRARAHLDQKKQKRARSRGGRLPMPSLPLDLLEDGETEASDRLFAVDRSIPAGPLPSATAASARPASPEGPRARRMDTNLLDAGPAEPLRPVVGPGAPPRPAPIRRAPPRPIVPPARPLPRFVVPISTALALGLGYAAAHPLFEHVWLPRVPLARVAVVGTSVRTPDSIARALLDSAGAPLDRLDGERVAARVMEDPWIESAASFRLPDGTLLVRVVERRAIARYQTDPEAEVALLDPAGRPFRGRVDLGGALPLVEGPVDGDTALSPATLEILEELRRHEDFARDPMALTLHLPGSAAIARGLAPRPRPVIAAADPATDGETWADDAPPFSQQRTSVTAEAEKTAAPAEEVDDTLAGETGYVLEIGREGPRALLGQSFLKRRIARLAALLAQRDAVVASARIIDLRFADRAVLRTEPTSG